MAVESRMKWSAAWKRRSGHRTYYEWIATAELADEFYSEVRHYVKETAERPNSFSIGERALRRVNLERFPDHFLFRIVGDVVRILVVVTTADVPLLVSGAANGAHGDAMMFASCIKTNV